MARQHQVTIAGNLTGPPQVREVADGKTLVRFSIAETPEKYDREAGEWRKEDTLFWNVTAWNRLSENIAKSALKGNERVVVTGTLHARTYETEEGEKRTAWEVTADDFAVSVLFGPFGSKTNDEHDDEPTDTDEQAV